MRNNIGPIIEGLSNNRLDSVNEGTSVFSNKLNAFIKDEDKDTQDFVKKALNAVFVGFKKKYGGYQEGKRPVQRDMGSYKIFTMKIQVESDDINYWKDVKEFFKPFKFLVMDVQIDGERYHSVLKDVDEEIGDSERSASGWADISSPAKNIIVGVAPQYMKNQKVSKDSNGDTFKVIVSLPIKDAKAFSDNKFASHSGNQWSLHHDSVGDEDWGLNFDEGDNEFSIWSRNSDGEGIASADTFHLIYKPNRKARDAFFEIMNTFNARTTRAEVENIISKYGVKLKHSYWFNPYTD